MESVQDEIKKIPIALTNLGVKENFPQLCNYIHNVILTCLKDKETRKRLNEKEEKVIEELSKL